MSSVAGLRWGHARVVVAHGDDHAVAIVAEAVRAAGLTPLCLAAGDVTASVHPALPGPPAALVLDVGLVAPMAFQIVDAVRAAPHASGVPIVLLSTVHHPGRYRRRPTTLHGADAVVDLPDVAAALPPVLARLVGERPPPRTAAADAALLDALVGHVDALVQGGVAAVVEAVARARSSHRAAGGDDESFAAAVARLGKPRAAADRSDGG